MVGCADPRIGAMASKPIEQLDFACHLSASPPVSIVAKCEEWPVHEAS